MAKSKKEIKEQNRKDYLNIFKNVTKPINTLKDLDYLDYENAYSDKNINTILKEVTNQSKYTFLIECIGKNIKLTKEHWTDILEMSSTDGYDLYDTNFNGSLILHTCLTQAFKHLNSLESIDKQLFENLKDIKINKKSANLLRVITDMAYNTNNEYEMPWLFNKSLLDTLNNNSMNYTLKNNLEKLTNYLPDLLTGTIDTHIYGHLLTAVDLINTYEKSKHIKSYQTIIKNIDFNNTGYREIHKWLRMYQDKELFDKPINLETLLKQNRVGTYHVFNEAEYKSLQFELKYGMSNSELEAKKGSTQDIIDIYKSSDPSERLRALDNLDDMLMRGSENINELRVSLMNYYSEIMNEQSENNDINTPGVTAVLNFISTFGRTMSDIITDYKIGILDENQELIDESINQLKTHLTDLITISKIEKMFDVVKNYMEASLRILKSPSITSKDIIPYVLNIYTKDKPELNKKLILCIELGLNDSDLLSVIQTENMSIPDINPENTISF